ncbi:hypothetical protein BCR42DRAFT_426204 [Absidia repens]|uniref:F-box domain-containing protein n=1 Tax=Absidia repens TaxID=90262 RepID=A0A1X2I1M3_9FUNG|nr:hypothetical protein BCR42DRAFT_426204 [Absidia repens]
MQLLNLPQEIYKNITRYMNTNSILILSRTCRTLFYIIRNDNSGIWHNLDYTQYQRVCFVKGRNHEKFAHFLCNVLTAQSRSSINTIHLISEMGSPVERIDYHNRKLRYWHLLVKTLCPNLVSLVFHVDSLRLMDPPPSYLFTIGYIMNNVLFDSQHNNDVMYYLYDLYISKCDECSIFVCNDDDSKFLCEHHELGRKKLIQ